jgi:hypothetical protein
MDACRLAGRLRAGADRGEATVLSPGEAGIVAELIEAAASALDTTTDRNVARRRMEKLQMVLLRMRAECD